MNKFFKKLEFDQIVNDLATFAVMTPTRQMISKIVPLPTLEQINKALDETDEALRIIQRLDRAPIYISEDIRPIINVCEKGAVLSGNQVYQFICLFQTIKANFRHLQILEKEDIKVVWYEKHLSKMFYDEKILKILSYSVDESGYLLDEASTTLGSIRRKIKLIDNKIKQKLQELVVKEGAKLSQTTVSMRDDHFVLAVKAEYKNIIKGTVYDVSASNQTFFIEPAAITQLNFEKRQLFEEEKVECQIILKKLSSLLQPDCHLYKESFETILAIDYIFSKACLAKKHDSHRPMINDQHTMSLIDARHPLLNVPKVIPNTVDFEQYLGIIITGPNTGGKTVLLKTIGLLSIMVKCGLLIPASPKSNMMIYDKICCDIGDDQSIIENLSTFSSHMHNIVSIINMVTPHSLVLFDEIGGGTDPTEGFNLAIAILKYLISHKISFITTTHYSELKLFAYETPGIINASMQFNQETLSPTYQLVLGLPGASNAFNIAARLGMKKEIIEVAEQELSRGSHDVKKIIDNLEKQMHQLKEKEHLLDEQIEKTKNEQNQYQLLVNKFNQEKNKIIDETKKSAQKDIEKTTKELKALLEAAKKLTDRDVKLHEINTLKREFDQLRQPAEPANETVSTQSNRELKVGDDVFVKKYEQYASIVKVFKNDTYEIMVGNMRLKAKGIDLSYYQEPARETENYSPTRVIASTPVKLNLDLRGTRYEEAKDIIVKYFDDLLLSNIKQVTIVHGYGTGTIRKLVQEYLKQNKSVLSYRYGGAGEGGMGSTIVTLK